MVLYAIYNPTNQASALLAANATTVTAPEVYGGANMPTGYTASALVSVWKTTLASLLDAGEQRDRHIDIRRSSIMTVSTEQSSHTQVTSSLLTPINAKTIYGDLQAVGGSSVIYSISPRSDEIGAVSFQFGVGTSQSPYRISITSPQKFSYKFIGGAILNIWTSGYDF
ncbi:hypothetical protein QVN83_18400 [Yersinia frederiksenii]|uniref:hypothetical protein n=1 Tax=Yersinia frederiksenii TaxID=29484 RepID=UPI0025AA34F3|nr:hypothetical protein [Yersinia frederiksenii]MDN0120930.1 hypothetical protein [Yersinia frederiksenii]